MCKDVCKVKIWQAVAYLTREVQIRLGSVHKDDRLLNVDNQAAVC